MLCANVSASKVMTVLDTDSGKSYVVDSTHPNFDELKAAVKAQDTDTFLDKVSVEEAVKDYVGQDTKNGNNFNTGVVVIDGEFFYNGKAVHSTLSERILSLMREGFPFEPMLRFFENLMENPSNRSVEELYTFLEANKLPITEDGHFLAYKCVRDNYMDKYSGTFDNSPGAVMEMPRREVDDRGENTCSHGFHCGGLAYSGPNGWYHSQGDRIVIVKVNPRDAVSVPHDHESGKLRVCRYEVVKDYFGEMTKVAYKANADEYDEEDFDDDDEDDELDLDVSYDGYSVYEGDEVTFDYLEERRHGYVEKDKGDLLVMEMLSKDKSEGEYRSFHKDEMSNVEFV